MRLPLILVLPVLLLGIAADIYIYRTVRSWQLRHARFWKGVLLWSSVLLSLAFAVMIAWPKKAADDAGLTTLMWCLYAYFSIYIPKYIFVIISLICRIPQLFRHKPLPGSRAVPTVLALATFAVMVSGVINTRRIDINTGEYSHPDLPEAFEGLEIIQISDLHTGTYGTDTSFVSKLVDSINGRRPDVIVFTGDIVNRHTSELEPFVPVLARLNAPLGVYSILGNHDYGDYYKWPSPEAKAENRRQLLDLQRRMGWKMLNNESAVLRAGGDSIVLIGVENIGDPPFPVYGDLDKAYSGDPADPAFKILLSHNPAHWCSDIAQSPDKNIALTLSGHTHAMQMSVGGKSPAAFRYPTWGGMYTDTDGAHDLYVNIGTGEVGIPARIGATPEVTVFRFSRGPKTEGYAKTYKAE